MLILEALGVRTQLNIMKQPAGGALLKSILKSFAIITGECLCGILFFDKVAGNFI